MRAVCVVLLVVCVVTCAWASAQEGRVRGVPPREQSLFKGETFACRRDPSKKLPISRVNDDYCDCEDGSDEPGTSACKSGSFFCENKGHTGENIFSSRVNDGICDCCDGSDEFEGRVTCPNTCAELGAVARKQQEEERAVYERGLQIKDQWIAEAQEGIRVKREEIEKNNQQYERASQVIKDLEAEKAGYEEKEKAERDVMEAHRAAEKQKMEAERQQKEAEELERLQREGPPPTEAPTPPPAEVPVAEQGAEGSVEEGRGEGGGEGAPSDGGDSGSAAPAPAEPEEPAMVETEALKAILEDKGKVEQELGNARRDQGDAERNKKNLEDELANDFGPQNEYFHLLGKCFDYKTREYTYTFCPYESVKQSSTSLGKYEKWDPAYSVMKFANGQQCWGGPKRSAAISFSCGDTNELSDVAEPSKCEYTMHFKTPAACARAHYELFAHTETGENNYADKEL